MGNDQEEAPEPTEHTAPERLVNWLLRPGIDVRLLVTREDGQPLNDADVERLDASISAYEEKDVEDTGAAFEPPDGDEA